MPKVTIDGRALDAVEGQTILETAREAGILIPTLCYHKDLSVVGACRLCVVEVENLRGRSGCRMFAAGERRPVGPHRDAALAESRRFVLECCCSRYTDAGYAAGDRDDTEFLRWVRRYERRPPEVRRRPAPRR